MLLLLAIPGLVTILIYLVVVGIVLAVAYYIINSLFPEPFKRWAILVLVVIGAILLIYFLLGLVGGGGPIRL